MNLSEEYVDIIVPFFPSEKGYKNLERLKKSLIDYPPGLPYNLIIAEGKKPCVQNRNDGLKKSTSRYFIMCDDDIEFTSPNWLKDALGFMIQHPNIGLVGFHVLDPLGNTTNAGRYITNIKETGEYVSIDALEIKNGNEYAICQKNLVPGCCMLIDRLVAGYFPEALYPDAINSEDSDYQMTIQANGFEIWYIGQIKIKHYYKNWEEKVGLYDIDGEKIFNHGIFSRRWNSFVGTVKK